jgi:hypothetical protein
VKGSARVEVLRGGRGAPARLAKSSFIVDQLEPVADRILAAAQTDPNSKYAEAVYKRVDRKRADRARWIITLPPFLEPLARRVEAKRGTMRRAARGV